MSGNNRRETRHTLTLPAEVHVQGGPAFDCHIIDISDGGAHLHIPTTEMPRAFYLIVAKGTRVARYCEVAWQNGLEYGVKFKKERGRLVRLAAESEPERLACFGVATKAK
jgi:hypothetical protein